MEYRETTGKKKLYTDTNSLVLHFTGFLLAQRVAFALPAVDNKCWNYCAVSAE